MEPLSAGFENSSGYGFYPGFTGLETISPNLKVLFSRKRGESTVVQYPSNRLNLYTTINVYFIFFIFKGPSLFKLQKWFQQNRCDVGYLNVPP
jgi:hypothetical protein